MKKFFEEFKEFALKGNVMDMAIGVIISAAFGNIVSSLNDSFINPLIALICGGNSEDGVKIGGQFVINGVAFDYGSFLSAVINFLIIALVLFCMLKAINGAVEKAANLKKKEEAAADPTTKICPKCQSEINIKATKCPCCTADLDA